MKKTIILTAALFFTMGIQAQNKIQFGVKAGLNVANTRTTPALPPDVNMKSRIGFNAGVFANIMAAKNFAIQPEAYYSSEGYKGVQGGTVAKLNMDYINIPVLAQYKFGNGFRVEAGPQIGFLLSAKSVLDDQKDDVKDMCKSIAFSIPFGAGYLSPIGLGLNARYNLGLTNFIDQSGSDQSAKISVFQFGLFYQFKMNKEKTKK